MPGQSIFAKLKGTLAPKKSAPPPYDEPSTLFADDKSSINRRGRKIRASDIPQWKWSTEQCRQWLTAFLIERFSCSPADAAQTAEKFDGFGPNIYLTREQGWKNLIGVVQGAGIYVWLLAVRHKAGAVPKTIVMTHGWADKSKNKP
jgi:hypothetical protein